MTSTDFADRFIHRIAIPCLYTCTSDHVVAFIQRGVITQFPQAVGDRQRGPVSQVEPIVAIWFDRGRLI